MKAHTARRIEKIPLGKRNLGVEIKSAFQSNKFKGYSLTEKRDRSNARGSRSKRIDDKSLITIDCSRKHVFRNEIDA